MRGADPAAAKREKGVIEMVRRECPVSHDRAGIPLPTLELLRDLQLTTGDISGANLAGAVSNPLVQLAGAARPTQILDAAGINTIQINDGQEGALPRWRGNGGGWVQEGDTLTPAPLTLSSVAVSAKHCGAHINFSRRLRLGTDGDVQALIFNEMRRVVAQTIEDGLLNGTGTAGQPIGLIDQAAGSVTFAGASPTYSEMVSMVEALADADGDLGTAVWLMHPSRAAALATTEKGSSTGQFVLEAPTLRRWSCIGLPVLTSTQVPEAKVILMDPRAASIIYFGVPQLMTDPFSGSNSVNGATTVIVSNYVDLAVSEPDLVVVGSA